MQLTYSETMLLTGERHAPAGGFGSSNTKLPHNGMKVNATVLSRGLLCAALLDCEARGALRFEVDHTHKNVFFGLLGRRAIVTLYASPAKAHAYQASSIEARLCDLARGGEIKVMELIHTLLGADLNDPWTLTPALVTQGLMRRGLLRTDVHKRLLWTAQSVSVPNSTLALLRIEADQQIAHLLDHTKRNRPQLWGLLNTAIDLAHSARRKWDDSYQDR